MENSHAAFMSSGENQANSGKGEIKKGLASLSY